MHIPFSISDQQRAAQLSGPIASPNKADPRALAPEGEATESASGKGFTTLDEAEISPEGREASRHEVEPKPESEQGFPREDAKAKLAKVDSDTRAADALEEQTAEAERRTKTFSDGPSETEASREEARETKVVQEPTTKLRKGQSPEETLNIARRVFREALSPDEPNESPNIPLANQASSQIREGVREGIQAAMDKMRPHQDLA